MLIGKYPDEFGRYGQFGGAYVPETLVQPLVELTAAYGEARRDPKYVMELRILLRDFVGRPTPLTYARRLTQALRGAQIFLKREDLAHTGAHKINNALGQALLARRMGKRRIVAETGAGQHGVATAAVSAALGLDCVVYMGRLDVDRQAPNVERMRLLGAEVIAVDAAGDGAGTLKDAVNEAMRDWITNVRESYFLLGSALGPHPYPQMVRDFQSVIGIEARQQILEQAGQLPDELIACVGGGSNAMGLFHAFLDDDGVAMTGVEAGGRGIASGEHATRFATGSPGVFQGTLSYLLQDEFGQVLPTHSISAGLDYQAVGPEHALLRELSRVRYDSATDAEALAAVTQLCRTEGILPALESAHAIAHALKTVPARAAEEVVIINVSGRGDKDLAALMAERRPL